MTEEVLACPLINAVFTCTLLPLSSLFSSLFCLHKVILYVCFFFSYFLDYECPYARFLAIHDSSKDVFIHYWLGHVLGLSIVCNESSGNGGSRFRCKQKGEKVIAQIYQNRPMCTDSFTITNKSYSLSEDLKKFLSLNQRNFSFVTLPSNEGCSQFSLCLLVTVNLE